MKNRFITWLYFGSANDWAIILFVLSALISCIKSLCELFKLGIFPLAQMITNIIIIILFVISMSLAFMIDSTIREK
jgi:hypothetical protein